MLAHSSADWQSKLQDDLNIEYRQLVSRASTQRLHSSSLPNARTPVASEPLVQWELDDRRISKAKVEERLRIIGVHWDTFVRDIEQVEKEVYVLSPTRYVPTTARNGAASKEIKKLSYRVPQISKNFENELRSQMEVLRSLGKARITTQHGAPSSSTPISLT